MAVEVCGRAETVGFLPAFHISPSVRTGAASPREKQNGIGKKKDASGDASFFVGAIGENG